MVNELTEPIFSQPFVALFEEKLFKHILICFYTERDHSVKKIIVNSLLREISKSNSKSIKTHAYKSLFYKMVDTSLVSNIILFP